MANVASAGEILMYHYDPGTALDELRDDAVLPHPVHLRDMILRIRLDAETALELNREFQDYLAQFGEIQKVARSILEKLTTGTPKEVRRSAWLPGLRAQGQDAE
jgi:hypothetical protein